MPKRMAAGSGATATWLNRENKTIKIDFSGFDGNLCFRNDASILFFASNSYRSAFLSLGRDLEERFETYIDKDIAHLVLPYLFNFRHFVELELKALYTAITNNSPKITHDLKILLSYNKNALKELSFEEIDKSYISITEEKFNVSKKEACDIFDNLEIIINKYIEKEITVEYYRYIFEIQTENREKYLALNNPVIELDFKETDLLFKSVRDMADKLRVKLIEFIYVQFLF